MDKIFQDRHSVRSFQDKEISKKDLTEILEAANSAPSAGNLKAREIIIVKDQKIRDELAEAALGQDFVAEAPLVLVFFAVPEHSERKYGQRGRNLYTLQDATIAASFAWLQAVILGLAACWVGAFDDDEVKKIFKTKDDWQPVAIMPIGYEK
jgi:nitroreductase